MIAVLASEKNDLDPYLTGVSESLSPVRMNRKSSIRGKWVRVRIDASACKDADGCAPGTPAITRRKQELKATIDLAVEMCRDVTAFLCMLEVSDAVKDKLRAYVHCRGVTMLRLLAQS